MVSRIWRCWKWIGLWGFLAFLWGEVVSPLGMNEDEILVGEMLIGIPVLYMALVSNKKVGVSFLGIIALVAMLDVAGVTFDSVLVIVSLGMLAATGTMAVIIERERRKELKW